MLILIISFIQICNFPYDKNMNGCSAGIELMGWGTNFENINFDSRKILASTQLLRPTKY
jgi:hypothetical protein